MYLWCASCYHAHLRIRWEVKGAKYGVCPTCGKSSHRNVVMWTEIATANEYEDQPDPGKVYPLQQLLF